METQLMLMVFLVCFGSIVDVSPSNRMIANVPGNTVYNSFNAHYHQKSDAVRKFLSQQAEQAQLEYDSMKGELLSAQQRRARSKNEHVRYRRGNTDDLQEFLNQNPNLKERYNSAINKAIEETEVRMNETYDKAIKETVLRVNQTYDKEIKETVLRVNQTYDKAIEESVEYASFQCATKDGRFSLDQLGIELNYYESSATKKYRSIPYKSLDKIKETVKSLAPPEKVDAAISYAKRLYKFFKYSSSVIAEQVRQYYNALMKSQLEFDESLAFAAGTGAGLYYRFGLYTHPDNETGEPMPAIVEYLMLKKEGKPASLRALLIKLNHWPVTLKHLKFLNLIRFFLEPPSYYIDYIEIGGYRWNPIVMPITNLDRDFCRRLRYDVY